MIWPAARLAIHGAYKLDDFFPQVDDLRSVFDFLGYYLRLATRGDEEGNQSDWELLRLARRQEESRGDVDEGIRCALRALTDQSIPATHWDNGGVNLVLRSIRYAFQGPLPSQLSEVALSILPLVCDRWCNIQSVVATSEVGSHRGNQTSTIDVGLTNGVRSILLEVLFQMVGSPHLRQHVTIVDQRRPLELFVLVQEYCEPLRGCLENPDLVDKILGGDDPDAVAAWLAILWLNHGELIPQVREKVETITLEATRGERRAILDMCLQIMDSGLETINDELRKAEDGLEMAGDESGTAENESEGGGHDTGHARPTGVDTLRMRIANLEQTITSLAVYMSVDPDSTPP